MRTLTITIVTFNVTYGAAWSVLVLYATETLGMGAIGFGLLTTVTAVGGLLGTASYDWLARRAGLALLMRVGLVIETLTHLGLALTTVPWVAATILFVFGAHAFVWGITGPFWFAFVGSAVILALIWRELAHVAHADEAAPTG
ncbi:hypothetical protein [Blastococcus sp. SYSU DS1024]